MEEIKWLKQVFPTIPALPENPALVARWGFDVLKVVTYQNIPARASGRGFHVLDVVIYWTDNLNTKAYQVTIRQPVVH